jgi:glycine cleavage system H protein
VADIYAPVSGIVDSVNDALSDSPEMINSKPYDAWLMKIKASAWDNEKGALMDANSYKAYVMKVGKVAETNIELK